MSILIFLAKWFIVPGVVGYGVTKGVNKLRQASPTFKEKTDPLVESGKKIIEEVKEDIEKADK